MCQCCSCKTTSDPTSGAPALKAQDHSYTSHRRSLDWHRLPRPSYPRRANGRSLALRSRDGVTRKGWPTSFLDQRPPYSGKSAHLAERVSRRHQALSKGFEQVSMASCLKRRLPNIVPRGSFPFVDEFCLTDTTPRGARWADDHQARIRSYSPSRRCCGF
jgi:hypothetical protein